MSEEVEKPTLKSPIASQVPEPKTFYLLCIVPEAKKTLGDSTIVKAETTAWREELLSPVLFVMKVGPDAFKDTKRFPSGPSCAEGDFVLVRPNTGTRLKMHGRELRIIPDDAVEATVADPRSIERAGL